jgi:threonine synthase
MDILISSNLERLLYLALGAEECARCMAALAGGGAYTISPGARAALAADFGAGWCDESGVYAEVKRCFEERGYLIDTHTAVGMSVAGRHEGAGPVLVVSTASPYKFAGDVFAALSGNKAGSELSALGELSVFTDTPVPAPLAGLGARPVRFGEVIGVGDMVGVVM